MKTLKDKQSELKDLLAKAVELAKEIHQEAELNEKAAEERYFGAREHNLPSHVVIGNWEEYRNYRDVANDADHLADHLAYTIEDAYMFRNLEKEN